jgi:type VI secretion system protein ImpF
LTTLPQGTVSRRITPSLFDRLTDLDPRARVDAPGSASPPIGDAKLAVARDLVNLLNVRRSELDIPEEFTETNRSIAAYGIQDFSSSPMDADQIRRAIENCIRTFEPRLALVSVRSTASSSFHLSFRITAVLRADSQSTPLVFDAVLPTHSRRFQVNEGR